MSFYIGPKIESKIYHMEIGNIIAILTPVCATIGYIATRTFTSYNPIAGATFCGAALLGRLMLQPYFHTDSAFLPTSIFGIALNGAIATFAAVKGTPYVEEGLSFAASLLPSSISFPSVSSAFANLSGESIKAAALEHPYIAISSAALCTLFIARRAFSNSYSEQFQ